MTNNQLHPKSNEDEKDRDDGAHYAGEGQVVAVGNWMCKVGCHARLRRRETLDLLLSYEMREDVHGSHDSGSALMSEQIKRVNERTNRFLTGYVIIRDIPNCRRDGYSPLIYSSLRQYLNKLGLPGLSVLKG